MDGKKRRIQQVFVVMGVIGLLFAVGCGSSNKMTAQISGEKIFQADKAFTEAKDGNASQNAQDALAVAEGKLAKAKDAFAVKNYDYARAKATTRKNLDIADGIKKETEALRREIQQMSK
jgi:hypothetical protein